MFTYLSAPAAIPIYPLFALHDPPPLVLAIVAITCTYQCPRIYGYNMLVLVRLYKPTTQGVSLPSDTASVPRHVRRVLACRMRNHASHGGIFAPGSWKGSLRRIEDSAEDLFAGVRGNAPGANVNVTAIRQKRRKSAQACKSPPRGNARRDPRSTAGHRCAGTGQERTGGICEGTAGKRAQQDDTIHVAEYGREQETGGRGSVASQLHSEVDFSACWGAASGQLVFDAMPGRG
jgi:hypothetical protein